MQSIKGLARKIYLTQNQSCLLGELLSSLCRNHAAAVSYEKALSHLHFQQPNLPAQRRLRDA
jgi:hypothetical protein